MKQAIIKIASDADLEVFSDLQLLVQVASSVDYQDEKLMLILTDEINQDWSVMAIEGEVINQTPILNFMSDVITYEDEEEVLTPVTDITNKLHCVSGHKWTFE